MPQDKHSKDVSLPKSQSNPQDEAAAQDEEVSIWEELGIPPPDYRDESLAPEVDRDLLLQLVRKELPERTTRAVHHLIISFKSWSKAHAEIVAEEFRRTQGDR